MTVNFLNKMLQHLSSSKAGAVIVKEEHVIENAQTTFLVSKDPYVSFAKLAQLFDTTPPCAEGIAESAVIHPTAVIGTNVTIKSGTIVMPRVVINANTKAIAMSPHIKQSSCLFHIFFFYFFDYI